MNGEGDAELTERASLPGLVHIGQTLWSTALLEGWTRYLRCSVSLQQVSLVVEESGPKNKSRPN